MVILKAKVSSNLNLFSLVKYVGFNYSLINL